MNVLIDEIITVYRSIDYISFMCTVFEKLFTFLYFYTKYIKHV